MKMPNKPTKYEVLIKQYLSSILDIIEILMRLGYSVPLNGGTIYPHGKIFILCYSVFMRQALSNIH